MPQPDHRQRGGELDEAIDQLRRANLEANQAIVDAIKALSAVPTAPSNLPGWSRPAALIVLAAVTASVTALAAMSAIPDLAARDAALNAQPLASQERHWAESWAYLWHASPHFRECWGTHLRTAQPTTCSISLGGGLEGPGRDPESAPGNDRGRDPGSTPRNGRGSGS